MLELASSHKARLTPPRLALRVERHLEEAEVMVPRALVAVVEMDVSCNQSCHMMRIADELQNLPGERLIQSRPAARVESPQVAAMSKELVI